MVGSTNIDRYTTRRNERVTYILRAPEKRHRFGISALAVGKDELFTAGRDGTVRSWTLPATNDCTGPEASPSKQPVSKATKTFDEHVDWVNDIVLIESPNRLVSCSSDTTIKVWNPSDPSHSYRTLSEHTDYVKALTEVQNGVASGSLDGRVLVWDLATGKVRHECSADAEDGQARNGSVYCMSGSIEGNVLVSGSTDKTISVWDVRTGDRVVHLRGHSDSVRCLTMKHDAKYMLSGASDATVRLWDLRMQRCIRSFDSHAAGSVWALTANRSFESFVSGARDGSVWYSNITSGASSLVVPVADRDLRNNMVLDVALSPCSAAVWVSSTGSTVRLWPLPSETKTEELVVQPKRDVAGDVVKHEVGLCQKGVRSAGLPLYTIPGLSGIVAHRIMNDKRHVLTCDTEGEYGIWDITRGVLEQSLGKMNGSDIDEVLKRQDVEVSVPSWFHVDIRLGSLSVRLEKSSVANAEIYAVDAGLEMESEEAKVNIGEHVVRGLFRTWIEKHKQRCASEDDGGLPRSRSPSTQTQKAPLKGSDLPPYVLPDHLPVVVTEDRVPVPLLRRTVSGFAGNEEISMPAWVVDLVRDGKAQTREIIKIRFSLEPADGSGLPQLGTTSLNAPRVLRVRKVTVYIAKELKDIRTGLDFDLEAHHLEILCNGQPLPQTMSLATVRQFRWRSPEDLHLEFRLKKGI